MFPRPPSEISDTTSDTPPLSPSSATRSSIASSNSSFSLGEPSSRSSRKFVHDSVTDIQEELDADMDRGTRLMDRGWTGHEAHRELHHPERTFRQRPQIPRQSSYSKRHSSFDTPREVPFPYGYLARTGGHLPNHSSASGEGADEQFGGAPLSPADSDRFVEGVQNGESRLLAYSADGSAYGESPQPHRPDLERSSSTSLPLPTSTSYFSLPPISSSASPSHSDEVPAPLVSSSLTAAGVGFSSSLNSSPCTTSLNPPVSKVDPLQLCSPARSAQQPQLSELPPFIAEEPDLNEAARSNDVPPSPEDALSRHSLPPPPKFLSSCSFASSPAPRPTSLPQTIDNAPSTRSSNSLPGNSPFPPPEPPTILTPPLPLSDAQRKPAPYEPFLPRDQLPPDHTYIAVETIPEEYRLIVRLPGFQRDAITLAMRRRRILHVVADNWSDGGGHFERRISFGYDADLATVRAEFDGEILRIFVPRREPPGWFSQPTQ